MSSNINNTIKYVRGQVWYVKDSSPISKYDQDNSIEHGNRPYLIFSSNEGNAYSPIVSGIPITSKIKQKSVNYTYRDFKGDDYCILCNMLTPISKICITRYMYTLSDEDMKEVEKRVLIAYGMYENGKLLVHYGYPGSSQIIISQASFDHDGSKLWIDSYTNHDNHRIFYKEFYINHYRYRCSCGKLMTC